MNVFTAALEPRPALVDIPPNKALSLHLPVGGAIYALSGRLWITQEGLTRDFDLSPPDAFAVERRGLIVITAIDGPAVAYLSPRDLNEGRLHRMLTPPVLDALHAHAAAARQREMARYAMLAARWIAGALQRAVAAFAACARAVVTRLTTRVPRA